MCLLSLSRTYVHEGRVLALLTVGTPGPEGCRGQQRLRVYLLNKGTQAFKICSLQRGETESQMRHLM